MRTSESERPSKAIRTPWWSRRRGRLFVEVLIDGTITVSGEMGCEGRAWLNGAVLELRDEWAVRHGTEREPPPIDPFIE